MFSTRTVAAADLGLARPHGLELAGALPPPPRLAIIGSRAAHRRFLDQVPTIVDTAGARGYSLVSGGALGIDSAAHRAALAGGVRQLAILPASPDAPYPPGNAELFAAIVRARDSGLIFTLERGRRPFRALFASRNALVIGASRAVVVVEASRSSGSCGSGFLALRQGLPVAALVGTPGCGALIAAGARPLVIEGATPIATQVESWLAALDGAPERPSVDVWPPELAALGAALGRAGPRGLTIDAMDDPRAALLQILEAEERGLILEIEPGRYRRVDAGSVRT